MCRSLTLGVSAVGARFGLDVGTLLAPVFRRVVASGGAIGSSSSEVNNSEAWLGCVFRCLSRPAGRMVIPHSHKIFSLGFYGTRGEFGVMTGLMSMTYGAPSRGRGIIFLLIGFHTTRPHFLAWAACGRLHISPLQRRPALGGRGRGRQWARQRARHLGGVGFGRLKTPEANGSSG